MVIFEPFIQCSAVEQCDINMELCVSNINMYERERTEVPGENGNFCVAMYYAM